MTNINKLIKEIKQVLELILSDLSNISCCQFFASVLEDSSLKK